MQEGNFGAFFVRKFVAQKKSFVQNSPCRRATLKNSSVSVHSLHFMVCTPLKSDPTVSFGVTFGQQSFETKKLPVPVLKGKNAAKI